MNRSDIDKRTKEDILKFIEHAAAAYTPEWRFDLENPDAGTALACVYVDMFVRTISQLNKFPDKNRIAFFNHLDAKIRPPVPAAGYAVFGMVNDLVDGAPIESGMGVYADTPDGEVAFETVDDLYATPARIEDIFQVCGSTDQIMHIFNREDENKAFSLFDCQGENLQKHVFYFCHDTVLDIGHEATIELKLYVRGDIPVSSTLIDLLLNPEYAVFEYYSSEGYEPLRPALSGVHTLLFHKAGIMPPFERTKIHEHESFWIRCRLLKMEPFEKFSFESFYLTAKGVYLYPELVNGNGIDCNLAEYMPFGERFGLYNEVYFACGQALSKKGSRIDFSFTMDFARIPLSDGDEGDGILWNWVMKKSDFKVDKEYDLTIEAVLWEYYNGNGWSRLFADESYEDIFSTELGLKSQYRTMTFTCPSDMVPVLINSCESCYIRARIVKINNLYKNKGYYVAPILSDTVFSYDYTHNPQVPQWLCLENNLESETLDFTGMAQRPEYIHPFKSMGIRENAVYIGFNSPLDDGPVKMLFTVAESGREACPALRWEYCGSRGFTALNLVDETDNFAKTGIVTILGNKDFARRRIFGRELYWLRITREDSRETRENGAGSRRAPDSRAGLDGASYPLIQSIHMNAVRVLNVDITGNELFSTERYEENKIITLLHPHVISLTLWVDEAQTLGERQIEQLRREREVECIRDGAGILLHAWVLWDEVPDFIGSGSTDRCYVLDRNEGVITFGNGRHGKIIPAGKQENIRVRYRCGGGERSNLPAGSLSRMAHTVGFVSSVTNPADISGGCDQESLGEALVRSSEILRHHFRAVTAADFEQLAMEASRNIRRVQCFTGYDAAGQPCPGAVTLVVLQKEFLAGRYAFNDIRELLYQYMRDKVSGSLMAGDQFFIVEPQFVEVCIRMDLITSGYNGIFQMKKDIESRLASFLNPLTGHFDGGGWKIGTFPTVIQIQNLLRDVHGVKYIRNIYLSAYVTGRTGRCEADLEIIRRHPFILPVNGIHDIRFR